MRLWLPYKYAAAMCAAALRAGEHYPFDAVILEHLEEDCGKSLEVDVQLYQSREYLADMFFLCLTCILE